MKVCAIDSSGMVASVAIVEDDRLIAEYTIDYKKTHSQTLLPMLDEVKNMIDLDLSTIDYIVISKGPGSFTGLRIGSATAKGLAQALNKPIVEVETVDAMAYELLGFDGIICPIMDARRNQVYTGFYTFEKDNTSSTTVTFKVLKEQFVADMNQVIEELNAYGKTVMFQGDAIPVQLDNIKEGLKVPYGLAPAYCNRQKASALAALGIEYAKQGKFVTAKEHKPEYLRLSQAERERLEKENNKKENGEKE